MFSSKQLDIQDLQVKLEVVGDHANLIRKRVEVALSMLALGDEAAVTNIDIAIATGKKIIIDLEQIRKEINYE